MKKLFMTAAVISALTLGVAPAIAADTEYKSETTIKKDDDGDMKTHVKVESTDDAGTNTLDEKTIKVDADDDGDYKKTTEIKKKVDPKGMFNTTDIKVKDTVESEDGKTTIEHKKTIDGETVESSKVEQE
ncbi:MAG: hypothetical protein ACAH80_03130 [Alphaproteobacteria bacterium]